MSEKKKLNETGAAEVIWDLSDLYPAADAPELKRDQKRLRELASRFQESYRGKVKGLSPSGLAQALTDYEEIIQVSGKIEIGRASCRERMENWVRDEEVKGEKREVIEIKEG